MPKEASNHFGQKLMPFLKAVAYSNPDLPFEEQTDIPPEIRKAIIVCQGKLTKKYEYIMEMRKAQERLIQKSEEYMAQI
jgi:hypothetical protein